MRLELLPFEDTDGEAYCNICWDAFSDGIMPLIYPKGFTPAARAWVVNNLLDEIKKNPQQTIVNKVVDHDANGKVVSIAWWKIYPKERSEDELVADEKEHDGRGFPPDCNLAMIEEFHDATKRYRREELGGRAHMVLQVLVVFPQYHRKGVGSMHLDAGLKIADQLGVPSWLEATPEGRPLYERKGFETVRQFEFDTRKWGLDRDMPHVCMLRPASVANGAAR